jgi:hypothetical protein
MRQASTKTRVAHITINIAQCTVLRDCIGGCGGADTAACSVLGTSSMASFIRQRRRAPAAACIFAAPARRKMGGAGCDWAGSSPGIHEVHIEPLRAMGRMGQRRRTTQQFIHAVCSFPCSIMHRLCVQCFKLLRVLSSTLDVQCVCMCGERGGVLITVPSREQGATISAGPGIWSP